jgi:hypothetical protein
LLDRLLPPPTSLSYQGSRIAPWLAGAVLLLKMAIGFGSILNGRGAASGADGIPLDSYSADAAQTVLALFGLLGASQVLVGAAGLVVLIRYRGLLPALLLFMTFEFLARKAVVYLIPIHRDSGAQGGAIAWAIFAVIVVAWALSMRRPAGHT